MQQLEWHTEKRKIKDLIPWGRNPRKMTGKQNADLKTSLDKFNLMSIPVVNTDNTLVSGHQRARILVAMGRGEEEIDVRVPNRALSEEEIAEANIRENKNLGEWDFDQLANFDEEMLKDIGFESSELDRIFQLDVSPEDDAIPENVPVVAKRGEIYQLGRHRLMCGDSTDAGDVALLMDGKKADTIFSDPPYNVDYRGMQNSKQWDGIANDMMAPSDFEAFLVKAFTNFYDFSSNNAGCYICHADKSHKEFRNAFEQVGFEWRATIIWVKNSPAFNFAQYKYKHEPIFYCYKKGATVNWYGDRTQNTVWEAKKETGDHPTIKPVALITKAIENSSPREGIVIDLFLGSGSTLIACEKTNRICYGMELDCHYADVIIKRFEDFTGQKAVRL